MLWNQVFWDTTLYYRVTDGAAIIFKRLALADKGSNTLGATHERTQRNIPEGANPQ